jgi:hypothetical protein
MDVNRKPYSYLLGRLNMREVNVRVFEKIVIACARKSQARTPAMRVSGAAKHR